MPEGDTIFRAAASMHRWLRGREITAARCALVEMPIHLVVGRTVDGVEARAKHLLVQFDSGHTLHTHMKMTGSWHVYRAGERWRKPEWQARLVLEAGDRVAVCFNAPVIELLVPGGETLHPGLAGLGPDVLKPPVDLGEVRRRAAERALDYPIGDLLLDQQVVSGIGNIWRCEALFVGRVHPGTARSKVTDEQLDALVTTAADLMGRSAQPTAHGGRDFGGGTNRPWVYGRARRPCRRCRTPIAAARMGRHARTAYWCPRCQPALEA
ncbi:MAG: Formamidopyrimidine-DNA glycosylase [uncultured Acidimicrobiales bacterium]|uniref:DNA-(apurinic or apyrimidinic site) lyase n=1 Tax=uncultured Acidimicrobiales bacterium TaxID=310071 RepID=A0A6J4IDD5_9ACTN|nr:MAG: Formamidopyrimidine-DNA glycosylase [uncultured Acidimicrobiales bacterium]